MDGQHSYEISLKKDDLFINLSSDDVYFISKQMDKWFRILMDDSYVPVSLPQRPQAEPAPQAMAAPPVAEAPPPAPAPQPSPEPPAPAPIVAEPAPPQPEPAPAPPPQPIVEQPAPQPEPIVAPVPAPEPPVALPEPQPVMAAAPAPVVDLPPVMQPQPVAPPAPPVLSVVPQQPAPEPTPIGAVEAKPKDDFDNVMDSVMRDLEAPPPEPRQPALPPVLADEGPLKEPADLTLISSLSDLCEQAHAGTSEDYLLLASYYLNQMEHQEAFSLKRINSNLVKSGLTPVNHSVLEAVLTKGYLAMVPDMTGTAEVSEYMITPLGLNVVNDLF